MTIKILNQLVKDDWISISFSRFFADFHPFTVKNLCSGVHFTFVPSWNVTSTRGAFIPVFFAFLHLVHPRLVNTPSFSVTSIIRRIPLRVKTKVSPVKQAQLCRGLLLYIFFLVSYSCR